MASGIYGSALNDIARSNVDLDTDTFYVMLTTSSYTEDFDTHNRRDDVTNEVSGTGYTAGGQSVTVTVNAYDTTNNRQEITLGGATWAASTITARKAIYYKRRGGASSADEVIGVNDFGSDVTSTAGTFTLNSSTFRLQN